MLKIEALSLSLSLSCRSRFKDSREGSFAISKQTLLKRICFESGNLKFRVQRISLSLLDRQIALLPMVAFFLQ